MKVLLYNGLAPETIPGFEKLVAYLAADDFRSAEVRKVGENLYRARLDRSDRLLFAIYRHRGERYALLLEHIPRHAYERSRFLARGVRIEEDRIPALGPDAAEQAPELPYVNPKLPRFHLLDKVLSFDEEQESAYRQPVPLVIIGSAGSGKTALTLEKMKGASGDVLYVTRSPFLAQNARELYYANGYVNEAQSIDFLSFREYLESIRASVGAPARAGTSEPRRVGPEPVSTAGGLGATEHAARPERACPGRARPRALGARWAGRKGRARAGASGEGRGTAETPRSAAARDGPRVTGRRPRAAHEP